MTAEKIIEAQNEVWDALVQVYPFLELPWQIPPADQLWEDGTEFIGAIKLRGGKWEIHTLKMSCDDRYFQLTDCNGDAFDAYPLEDFNFIAIQSGGIYDFE